MIRTKLLRFACISGCILFLIIGALAIYNLVSIKKYNSLNNELCNMYMASYNDNRENTSDGKEKSERSAEEGSGIKGAADLYNEKTETNEKFPNEYSSSNKGSADTEHSGIDTEDIDSILIVKKIDLEMPVFNGKNRFDYLGDFFLITGYAENRYGDGNYYIFGHQSRTFGYSLNRLNSLSCGDEIIIYKAGTFYTYYVESITKTWEMIIDRNTSETTNSIVIYTCDKSRKADKPYIKLCAGLKKME